MMIDLGPIAAMAPSSMVRHVVTDSAGVEHRVLVVRIADSFYAIGDVCSHADVSLSEGELWADDCEVECPKHGSLFSVKTGKPSTFPATQPVPIYTVTVTGETLLLELS
jgi:3-phenylpropionate/trans-cinnamate dioxygenase ferredoxin component